MIPQVQAERIQSTVLMTDLPISWARFYSIWKATGDSFLVGAMVLRKQSEIAEIAACLGTVNLTKHSGTKSNFYFKNGLQNCKDVSIGCWGESLEQTD